MKGFKQLLVFTIAWVAGCVVFDGWLQVKGGWLMSAGVITWLFSIWASGMGRVTFAEEEE